MQAINKEINQAIEKKMISEDALMDDKLTLFRQNVSFVLLRTVMQCGVLHKILCLVL